MSTRELSSYGTSDVMQATGISLARLYYWERIGLLFPDVERFGSRRYRRYGEDDVRRIRSMMRLLAEGYSLQGAARLTRRAQENGQPMTPDGGAESVGTAGQENRADES